MKIGILGGTGNLGRGLAVRWARAGHEVVVGSRQLDKAEREVAKMSKRLLEHGHDPTALKAANNPAAAQDGKVVILSAPVEAHGELLGSVSHLLKGKILVDCSVDLNLEERGSSGTALRVQDMVGDRVAVVAGFHTVAASKLADLSQPTVGDVLLAGDATAAKETVARLAEDLGLRSFDAGPLGHAATLERLTALLIFLNRRYRRRGIGIQLTGI